MSEHDTHLADVTPFSLRARQRAKDTAQGARGARRVPIAGREFLLVPDSLAPNGHRWLSAVGKTVLGEDDWKEVSAPAQRDVIAALYEAVRTN